MIENPRNMRTEFLRGYVLELAAAGIRTPAALTAALGHDLKIVLNELTGNALANGVEAIGARLHTGIGKIVGDVAQRGLRAVWGELLEQYDRGVAATHGEQK